MNSARLMQAIESICPIVGCNSEGVLHYASEATPAQIAAAHAALTDYDSSPEADAAWLIVGGNSATIDLFKQAKLLQIDEQTESLISGGFTYNGQKFSLSASAQLNWTNLMLSSSMLAYPLSVSTLANGQYVFASAAAVQEFYATGIGTVKSILDAGRALKMMAMAASTLDEINGVHDTR